MVITTTVGEVQQRRARARDRALVAVAVMFTPTEGIGDSSSLEHPASEAFALLYEQEIALDIVFSHTQHLRRVLVCQVGQVHRVLQFRHCHLTHSVPNGIVGVVVTRDLLVLTYSFAGVLLGGDGFLREAEVGEIGPDGVARTKAGQFLFRVGAQR
jgi:hypothetical protein